MKPQVERILVPASARGNLRCRAASPEGCIKKRDAMVAGSCGVLHVGFPKGRSAGGCKGRRVEHGWHGVSLGVPHCRPALLAAIVHHWQRPVSVSIRAGLPHGQDAGRADSRTFASVCLTRSVMPGVESVMPPGGSEFVSVFSSGLRINEFNES